ncbi:DNL-type zinc finger protein [Wallemia ichthyophaga EXF-994]|uniref:DNL-type zinc finger protein n=1 Tax=Wallemia ichthyophaga (strain EXF-994 / CBS 113033) TaxID=1299270 RepID=R9AG52_WALI9|nr:DNL-type zinc finger protein [Wallemia ichthyophaga EXF-994]EOR01173.1 DNL-type zinc finger protein [Wallemia ichthyophaga EXF-994]
MLGGILRRNISRSVGCSYRAATAFPKLTRPFTHSPTRFHKIPTDGTSTPIGHVDPRLQISFTCTVKDCGERSTHEFAKSSYTKGIVIVQCPGCSNRHLIADNLGWFKQPDTAQGELRTVEDLMRAKGEKVVKL